MHHISRGCIARSSRSLLIHHALLYSPCCGGRNGPEIITLSWHSVMFVPTAWFSALFAARACIAADRFMHQPDVHVKLAILAIPTHPIIHPDWAMCSCLERSPAYSALIYSPLLEILCRYSENVPNRYCIICRYIYNRGRESNQPLTRANQGEKKDETDKRPADSD